MSSSLGVSRASTTTTTAPRASIHPARVVMAVDDVTRACVARELDVDALVHYRPREGYIPIFARVARRPSGDAVDADADDGVFVVRLRESVEGVGEEGELKRAVKRDLADAFVVSTRVAAFGTTNGDAMTSEPVVGRVRSIDTTKWPPEFVIETTDGGKIRAWGRDACDAEAYEAETRRRRDARALADADAVANALLEEEERERERAERAAEVKRCKAKKKKRSTSDAAPKRDADGDGEEDDEAAALEREAKKKAAAEKAAAKAAARARQEEVKAAKAAREKAAKREAQKARKAAERAARETREAEEKAMVRDASGDENKEPKEEERSGDENKEPKEEERSSTKRPTGETVSEPTARVDAEPSSAQEEKTKTPTATQLRKLEKERRKAQRMAEIDAFLKAHELTAAQEETESTGGARKRKNKKKKKPAAGAAARLEPASARPFSQEWFATFAVIAFFTVLAAAYTIVSFVVKKTTGAVA